MAAAKQRGKALTEKEKTTSAPAKKDKPSWPVNLPQTSFPMKGDLATREPLILQVWEKLGLYERRLQERKDRPEWVLHDGPPYANGPIHIGHALNKILKDMAVKSRGLMGMRTPYVPGWDCHGLPIETALLKELKVSKRAISDLPAFRRQAGEFASRFIGTQREDFKRLGVLGDWPNPYTTMAPAYESRILRAFRVLMGKGYIYRGLRTVCWCSHCETALAEAEVEYKDKTSKSIFVAFAPLEGSGPLAGAQAVIWTTTPWTMPANTGLAFHPKLEYVLARVHWAEGERRWVLAKARLDAVCSAVGAKLVRVEGSWPGAEVVARVRCSRPFYPGKESRAVLADYVSSEDGTGIVHTAPGHGQEDFETGRTYGLDLLSPVDEAGRFTADAPAELQGKHVLREGNAAAAAALRSRGLLLGESDVQHSYPHCWRCKSPIVFRATEQWFLGVGHEGLRGRLLEAIDGVRWVPAVGKSRIGGMVNSRPDWCLSRQRVWGTPIPVLYCSSCRKPLVDDAVLESIEKKVETDGSDFWFAELEKPVTAASWPFLPRETKCSCGNASFVRERDILDVWIDSGASWLGVRPKGDEPADLYLEGSDQHRGWFQSSLVLSVAMRGSAPFKEVLTHGFVLDEHGHAMHKSAGNVMAPQDVIHKLGADVLRMWVALSDFSDDVRISEKLLDGPRDAYRKIRNTLRFLLGNLHDFDGRRPDALPELERFVLHRLAALQASVLERYRNYGFRAAGRELVDFCAFDLSAFYLDVLKDRLYTYAQDHPSRRAAQWTMAEVARRLLGLLSPIISFTAEEAWSCLPPPLKTADSVFLADLAAPEASWTDPELAARWEAILRVRAGVYKALEEARTAGRIGGSLQARVTLRGGEAAAIEGVDWAELLIVSGVEVQNGGGELSVEVAPAPGTKCPRCWRYQNDIGSRPSQPLLCGRCAQQLG
ncbi:MAG: isoleucine--tRNA ligase [Elusimicrobia bacterium]|nr:isoleucine--tRNA ligase [Elusimicrobiota bacterium]